MRPFADILARHPLLRPLILFVAGIITGHLCGERLSAGTIWFLATDSLLTLSVILLAVLGKKPGARLAFGFTCLALCFFLGVTLIHLSESEKSERWSDSARIYTGIVTHISHTSAKGCQLYCHLTEWRDDKCRSEEKRTILLHIYSQDSVPGTPVGSVIRFAGRIMPQQSTGNPQEVDYAAWYRRQNILGCCSVNGESLKTVSNEDERTEAIQALSFFSRLRLRALMVRERLLARYEAIPLGEKGKAILSALTLGEKNGIKRETRQIFQLSGAAHILALSGLHLGILFGVLHFLLLGRVRKAPWRVPAHFVVLACLWGFTFLAGLPISLLRATIMCSVITLSSLLRRKTKSLDSLILAAWIILFLSPESLLDAGFQLSFSCVFFILSLSGMFPWGKKVKNPILHTLLSLIVISLFAQIGAAGLSAFYFHIFPSYFLLTNIVAIPLTFTILVTAFSFLFLSVVPFCPEIIATLLAEEVRWLLYLLHGIASLPHASIALYPTTAQTALYYAVFLSFLWHYAHKGKQGRMLVLFSGGLLALTFLIPHPARRERNCIWFYNCPQTPAVHCIADNGESYLWTSDGGTDSLETMGRLEPLSSRFFIPSRLRIRLTGDSLSTSRLLLRDGLLLFGGKRLLLLHDDFWRKKKGRKIRVDILYVCRGFHGRLSEAASLFDPERVVLDASLNKMREQRLADECRSLGWPFHSIKRDGALRITLCER